MTYSVLLSILLYLLGCHLAGNTYEHMIETDDGEPLNKPALAFTIILWPVVEIINLWYFKVLGKE